MQLYFDVISEPKDKINTTEPLQCDSFNTKEAAKEFVEHLSAGSFYILRSIVCEDDFSNPRITFVEINYD